MGLKIFDEIARYRKIYLKKLNEDAGNENEDEINDEEMDDMGGGEEMPLQDPTLPSEDSTGSDNPEEQANPETGSFISDNKKAEFAKSLLTALMTAPPESGVIPQQYMNVTTKNADEVIKFIQTLCTTDNMLDDEHDNVKGSIASELKDMGNY